MHFASADHEQFRCMRLRTGLIYTLERLSTKFPTPCACELPAGMLNLHAFVWGDCCGTKAPCEVPARPSKLGDDTDLAPVIGYDVL